MEMMIRVRFFFRANKSVFLSALNLFFLIKIACSLIDFNVFFTDAIIGIYKITEL